MRWPDSFTRALPLAAILALHAAILFVAFGTQVRKPAPSAPVREVIATFVTPDAPNPQPAPPQARPQPPHTPPVVHKTLPRPKPVATPKHILAPVFRPKQQEPSPTPAAPAAGPAESAAPSAPPAAPAPPASAPAAPAAAPQPSAPKTVTSGVAYVQPPRAEYPPASRRLGEEGRSVLRVLVNERGRAERVELQKSSGSSRLDEAARQAVLQAVFKPYLEDGKPVAVFVVVPISFHLD